MTMQCKVIPAPGSHPNAKVNALQVFNVLQDGGVAFVPIEISYALMASSTEAVDKASTAKRRRLGHSQAFIGSISRPRRWRRRPRAKQCLYTSGVDRFWLNWGVERPSWSASGESSANLTGTGQKYCVEDIDPEIIGAADLIVDYGLQRCHVYGGRASTIIDFEHMEVLRVGSSYELLRERLMKYWGVALPMDPLFDAKSRAGESGKHNTS
ncbi:hypothetical protein EDB81DRAFT_905921 [Dactylonectria macrodidyma]|uniref:YrdC-like domain-containing protein n=1 Tax=Dactylonectria macrodidyma TaxID=307937 RepID=A0A9P9ISR5_9HYPO|nr:hypothetical protein EDB81DRAFT_905921 [Dactylonectria macrodidyma]